MRTPQLLAGIRSVNWWMDMLVACVFVSYKFIWKAEGLKADSLPCPLSLQLLYFLDLFV